MAWLLLLVVVALAVWLVRSGLRDDRRDDDDDDGPGGLRRVRVRATARPGRGMRGRR
jgi:hypothetical protein